MAEPLNGVHANGHAGADSLQRSNSISQASENSQTAQEYINSQLQLEADAREALPYQFDTCTKPMGPLRQILFSCLTCNPPPESPSESYTPAGVCYSCSISCHGEHTLVELFNKRNFECDCGTTRITSNSPCTLRINAATSTKGDVTGDKPAACNKYNHNFRNRFCGCGELYDAHQERGTMFQCLGLGAVQDGGCGEDWWHPECLVGLPRKWYEKSRQDGSRHTSTNGNPTEMGAAGATTTEAAQKREDGPDPAIRDPTDEDAPLPPGFPEEDDFEHLICYKCVDALPWLKRYAGTPGFLKPVFNQPRMQPKVETDATDVKSRETAGDGSSNIVDSRKRKADDDGDQIAPEIKRQRSASDPAAKILAEPGTTTAPTNRSCVWSNLPLAPSGPVSLFLQEDFRTHLCRCPEHFPLLAPHPPLLEEEETYSPPLSASSEVDGNGSAGTKSLLDRGEAALSSMDRVRALEGVMAYNHLKAGLTDFLRPFAENGQAVGAEDIKAYFEKLRGDAEGIKEAARGADEGAVGGDGRKEQGGY